MGFARENQVTSGFVDLEKPLELCRLLRYVMPLNNALTGRRAYPLQFVSRRLQHSPHRLGQCNLVTRGNKPARLAQFDEFWNSPQISRDGGTTERHRFHDYHRQSLGEARQNKSAGGKYLLFHPSARRPAYHANCAVQSGVRNRSLNALAERTVSDEDNLAVIPASCSIRAASIKTICPFEPSSRPTQTRRGATAGGGTGPPRKKKSRPQ